jgi:RES domain-containing protein
MARHKKEDFMSQHPESGKLTQAIARCVAHSTSWSGELYRCTSPRYANKEDVLTGIGSKTAGARWNPPNSFRTIYTSLDPHTSIDEVLAHFMYYELSIAKAMPRVIVSLAVRLRRVLDLTKVEVRRLVGVSSRRLVGEFWRVQQERGEEALTQAIGRLAFEMGWEGLHVPSAARKGGENLIIFPTNLDVPRSYIRIINKAALPPRP